VYLPCFNGFVRRAWGSKIKRYCLLIFHLSCGTAVIYVQFQCTFDYITFSAYVRYTGPNTPKSVFLAKCGMLYHLMTTLDGVIKEMSLHMGSYPIGRQSASFKKSFDQQKAKPHLEFDETFIYVLFRAQAGNTTAHHHLTQSSHLHPSDAWV
jgi:hypothetical protein